MEKEKRNELFWSKVKIGEKDECWNWVTDSEEAWTKYKNKKVHSARVAWILSNGEIEKGLCVLHTCNNKLCCNPSHLFLETLEYHLKRERIPEKYRTCKNCGEKFGGRKRDFCTLKCSQEYLRKEFIEKWIKGEISGSQPKHECLLSDYIRNWLLEKKEYKCEKCGWGETNPTTGKIPLSVHHINGNSSDHSLENLIVLCPNCHSLTATYCSLNRGNGRKIRTKYIK